MPIPRRWITLASLLLPLFPALVASAQDSPASGPGLSVREEVYGALPDGTEIRRFTLSNADGVEASIMTLGATLTTVKTPDRDGNIATITLHKTSLDEYVQGHPAMGSLVGRYANRIANARFFLDGVQHHVTRNHGDHHLHGGTKDEAFHWQVWDAETIETAHSVGVTLTLTSPMGQAGFPGALDVEVTYGLTDKSHLAIVYRATTDKATVLNLTNHAYWNLAGHDSGEIFDHLVRINADFYLPVDEDTLPTGEIRTVNREGMDFRTLHPVGAHLADVPIGIYDHCYVLNKDDDQRLSLAAEVREPTSGRTMEVWTTQPGVQFYTGRKTGLCLETQHFPNAPNVPHFPSTVLRPGEAFRQTTIHMFGTDAP